ncbi:MAG TPA: pitrilysin family protein [Gammaproteobacteria bacterium]
MKTFNSPFRLIVLLAGLGLAQAATAATAAEPPEPAPPKPFTLPETMEMQLDNGLEATLVPYGSLPKVTVQVAVRTGNLNEGEKRWLADFTSALLQEGTVNRSAQEIAGAVAAMGGEIFVSTGVDETVIGGDVLAEFAPDLIKLLAEITRSPAFPESEAERIRGDLLRQLDVMQSQPQATAQEAFSESTYGKHPYGDIFPSAEQLQGYTAADAREFHEQEFGAKRTHVYVAGVFDEAAVREAIREAFGDWKPGPEVLVNVPESTPEHRVILVDRPGAPQSTLILGLPVVDPSHPDFVPLQVMNALLGGSFGSRITSNIREDKGYTYSPRSTLQDNYRVATWAEYADVTTAHTADSIHEILKEIQRLQKEPPPEAELDGIKNYLSGVFVLQNSSRGSIIGQLRNIELHGLSEDYLSTLVQRINAVTPETVSAMAREYLPIDDLTLVVVGDLETVKPQLQELDWIREGDLK